MPASKSPLLVTGAAGFIGSNFVRMAVERGVGPIVALDSLTYAGNLENLADLLEGDKIAFEKADIRDADAMTTVFEEHGIRRVAHFAAESHVDRSIMGSADFVTTNVVGTQVLLDLAKAAEVTRFLNVGTDEVYGTLPEDQPEVKFTEETPLQPNSPYSASKAGGDCLCRAYYETHKMPVLITRCSNNYGPYQFPEKLIPLFVTNLMEGKQVPLYGDGLNIRDWLHVSDHCDAILTVLEKGTPGEVYNVGGNNEQTNRAITEKLIDLCGRSWDEAVTYVEDRKGHDRRYAIDASKIKAELGWEPKRRWDEAIAETVDWYKSNRDWWQSIKSGAYRDYYEKQYANR
ncbi:MAG: dTDP-glucose 4,6-dehydratase [Planctomycetota bacterium]